MRVVRVALVFFSIGFLISTIEEAAGRGYPEGVRPPRERASPHGPSLPNAGLVSGGEQISGISSNVLPSRGEPGKHPEPSLEPAAAAEAIEWPASMAELHALRPQKRRFSEPEAGHISRIPLPVWMSTGSDPLAALPDREGSGESSP